MQFVEGREGRVVAISATFSADFSSFNAAIERADVKLRGLDSSSRFVERSLNRMTDNFSGRKLIQEATLMVNAIERIGGTSKLTETELISVGNKAAEAAEKMKRMGVEVPPKLEQLATAAQKPVSAFSSLTGVMGKLNPLMAAFGVSLSVGAVVSYAKEIGAFAGEMIDLSAQTGLSTTRLQAFNYVGAGVGLTVEGIAASADQLSRRLGDGDKSVVSALDKMGLSIDELKTKGLDEVMFEIDKSLVGVNNKFERAAILNDLFGRAGAKMGRLMTGALEEVTAAAEKTGAIMDEELLKKADEFDDAWAQGWIRFRAFAAESIGAVAKLLSGLSDLATGFIPAGAFGAPPKATTPRRIGGSTGIPSIDTGLTLKIATDPLAPLKAFVAAQKEVNKARVEEIKLLEQTREGLALWLTRGLQAPQAIRGEFTTENIANLVSSNLSTSLAMFGPQNIGGSAQGGGGLGMESGALGGAGMTIQRAMHDYFSSPAGVRISRGMGMLGTGGTGSLVAGALETGGGLFDAYQEILGATGSGSRAKRVAGGAATGAKIGTAILPGIGTAVGAVAGAIVGVFRGKSKGEQLNIDRDTLISQASGISGDKGASQAKFRELATAAGVASSEIDKLFSTHKQQEFEKGLDSITKKMGEFTSEQEADAARLEAAIEKYGFSIEQIGPKLQQQKLDAQAKELIEDWRVLVGAGIDLTVVNEQMSAAINEYVQTAVRLGTEVPAAMRPMLQKLLEQGLLTDEAGNAITDLEEAGITFAETMTEGFDRVVVKLDELIAKLIAAGTAIGDLPSVPDASGYLPGDQTQTGIWDPTRGGTRMPELQEFATGTGGRYLSFGRGTPVMLHGNERVMTESEGRAEGSAWSMLGDKLDTLNGNIQMMFEGVRRAARDDMAISIGRRV